MDAYEERLSRFPKRVRRTRRSPTFGALLQRLGYGPSLYEAATALGIPEATIKSRLYRCKLAMSAALWCEVAHASRRSADRGFTEAAVAQENEARAEVALKALEPHLQSLFGPARVYRQKVG